MAGTIKRNTHLSIVGATAVAAALGGAALSGGGVSGADSAPADEVTAILATTSIGAVDDVQPGDAVLVDECFFEMPELSQEDVEEINAESDELAAHLDAKGITYEWETDELGIRFPEPVEDD
ncbi:MAG: hypothetical protein GY925_28975, partial [Actinomycetia bacterium]|nr:hypothetical protein [Actinomycetes bacterium]